MVFRPQIKTNVLTTRTARVIIAQKLGNISYGIHRYAYQSRANMIDIVTILNAIISKTNRFAGNRTTVVISFSFSFLRLFYVSLLLFLDSQVKLAAPKFIGGWRIY